MAIEQAAIKKKFHITIVLAIVIFCVSLIGFLLVLFLLLFVNMVTRVLILGYVGVPVPIIILSSVGKSSVDKKPKSIFPISVFLATSLLYMLGVSVLFIIIFRSYLLTLVAIPVVAILVLSSVALRNIPKIVAYGKDLALHKTSPPSKDQARKPSDDTRRESPAKQKLGTWDEAAITKINAIFSTSSKMSIDDLARLVKLSRKKLIKLVVDESSRLNVKVDGDLIVSKH